MSAFDKAKTGINTHTPRQAPFKMPAAAWLIERARAPKVRGRAKAARKVRPLCVLIC